MKNFLLYLIILIAMLIFIMVLSGKSGSAEGEYYLGEKWIDAVISGKKTVDVRPGPISKYEHNINKEITYVYKDKSVKVKVDNIIHYDTLKELLKEEGFEKIAPHQKSLESTLEEFDQWFDENKIKELGGINAIHISSLENKAAKDKKVDKKKDDKKKPKKK